MFRIASYDREWPWIEETMALFSMPNTRQGEEKNCPPPKDEMSYFSPDTLPPNNCCIRRMLVVDSWSSGHLIAHLFGGSGAQNWCPKSKLSPKLRILRHFVKKGSGVKKKPFRTRKEPFLKNNRSCLMDCKFGPVENTRSCLLLSVKLNCEGKQQKSSQTKIIAWNYLWRDDANLRCGANVQYVTHEVDILTFTPRYRWVPLCPNTDNPNSQLIQVLWKSHLSKGTSRFQNKKSK